MVSEGEEAPHFTLLADDERKVSLITEVRKYCSIFIQKTGLRGVIERLSNLGIQLKSLRRKVPSY